MASFRRTLVGLKPMASIASMSPAWFQTNPRGVEASMKVTYRMALASFRRTLVGLKPPVRMV